MSGKDIFNLITGLLSGLALFMFGMSVMSDSLAQFAGNKMQRAIERIAGKRAAGFLFGTVVTAIVQSSSATTVLFVGMVNSGILELGQAVAPILGANLGTTATAWLLSLNGFETEYMILSIFKPAVFVPFLAITSTFAMIFARSERIRRISRVLIGFSVMMLGMIMMSSAVSPLREVPEFSATMQRLINPVPAFLFAMLFTMLIQSSDATVGIIQALGMSVGMTFGAAIPLVCGAQVGTCITALLSSIGANCNGRRTAQIHLFYNLIKTVPFLIILYGLDRIYHFAFLQNSVGTLGIPVFHSLINLIAGLIMLPMSGLLVALVLFITPYSDDEKEEQNARITILDMRFLKTPSFALEQAGKALVQIADTLQEVFSIVREIEHTENGLYVEKLDKRCKRIHNHEKQLMDYLFQIENKSLDNEDSKKHAFLLSCTEDFGKICSVIEEMGRIYRDVNGKENGFSAEAMGDMDIYGTAIQEILDTVISGFNAQSGAVADTIQTFREVIFNIHSIVTRKHMKRLQQGICDPRLGESFMLLGLSYERILDRCGDIALQVKKLAGDGGDNQVEYRKAAEMFKDKFEMLIGRNKMRNLRDAR